MTKHSKWDDREDAIQEMVDEGLTDAEIGDRWGVTGSTIGEVRKRLGIKRSPRKMTGDKGRENLQAFVGPALEGETYTDEAGLTVTRYPARYAGGLPPRVNARPRRG